MIPTDRSDQRPWFALLLTVLLAFGSLGCAYAIVANEASDTRTERREVENRVRRMELAFEAEEYRKVLEIYEEGERRGQVTGRMIILKREAEKVLAEKTEKNDMV